jgi:hypothetical protein
MQTHVLARYSRMDHGSHGIESSGLTLSDLDIAGMCAGLPPPICKIAKAHWLISGGMDKSLA